MNKILKRCGLTAACVALGCAVAFAAIQAKTDKCYRIADTIVIGGCD